MDISDDLAVDQDNKIIDLQNENIGITNEYKKSKKQFTNDYNKLLKELEESIRDLNKAKKVYENQQVIYQGKKNDFSINKDQLKFYDDHPDIRDYQKIVNREKRNQNNSELKVNNDMIFDQLSEKIVPIQIKKTINKINVI